MRYCLDNNIISYLFNEDSKYENLRSKFNFIQDNPRNEICTSIIVHGEIFQGLKKFEIDFINFENGLNLKKFEIEKRYTKSDVSENYSEDEASKLIDIDILELESSLLNEKLKHQSNIELIKRTNNFLQGIKTHGIDTHVVTKYVDSYYLQKDRREDFKNLSKKNLKAEIQKSYHDLWIAATCLAKNLILVTNNEDDFKFIPTLSIENWTT